MIIFAVDPGKTTGLALWSTERELIQAGEMEIYPFQCWAEENIRLYAGWDLQVVCEDFLITQQTARNSQSAHWAFAGIEVLKFWCKKWDVPLTMHSPSKKSFASDDKLRNLGWYESTPGGHQNDACRHLLTRLVDLKAIKLQLLA